MVIVDIMQAFDKDKTCSILALWQLAAFGKGTLLLLSDESHCAVAQEHWDNKRHPDCAFSYNN